MCLQAYYNYNSGEELKLDLLKEIEELGIDNWNKKVDEERKEIESK